jgi:hypothetical protein
VDAVIIEFAEFVVPRGGDALQLGGGLRPTRSRRSAGQRSRIAQSNIVTVLISEGLHDLNELVVGTRTRAAPHSASDEAEMTTLRRRWRRSSRISPRNGSPGRHARGAADGVEPRRGAVRDRAGAAE